MALAPLKILVLNAGSSSQKSRLYELGDVLPDTPPTPLWETNADWTQEKETAKLKISTAHGQKLQREVTADSRPAVIEEMLKTLWSGETQVIAQPSDITLVGHRVVHGGPAYTESVRITPQVKEKIKQFASFAPLHNPVNLEGIEAIERVLGNIPQVAVFDTTFHKHLPMATVVYPGPYEWFEQGIRRYGFHGISHQYCTERIGQILEEDEAHLRIINCHLGNGCSLAAIQNGASFDTTMGFTPLEGVMMGSRSGTVDPSILIYLQREKGYTADQFDQVLNKESGLKGLLGENDFRELLQRRTEGDERAQLAFDVYCHRLRKYVGAYLAVLESCDGIVFGGGVGEHVAEVRAAALEGLTWAGIELDPALNAAALGGDVHIHAARAAVKVCVVSTDAEAVLARAAAALAGGVTGEARA